MTIRRIACVLLPLVSIGVASADPLNGRPIEDDVFYMYMPIAWRDSDSDTYRFGDFGGMTAALPYLQDLGITAVWMNPIFPSPAYHGYQHGRADQLNPWFGTEQDFLDFVQAAHDRGIKVFIDFVVYGISHESPWYEDAYANPGSPYDDWLAFENSANTQYLGYTFPTWNGDTVGFIHWNLNNAAASDLVTSWGEYWLDPNSDGNFYDGVDGYRLDHVSAWHSQESPWGYHLDWWIGWHADLKAVNPDMFTFAEQADWGLYGQELLPPFGAAMTKPFEFAARDAVANENAAGLYTQMNLTMQSLPAGSLYLGTISDHDVDRLTSVIGGGLDKAKAAAAVLMLQPFPPVIYYGDEIGMLGFKASYGGDANDIPMREPFKWNAVAGPPMSNYFALNSQAYNNRYSQNNDGRSVEEQDGVSGSLLETYRTLIALRKNQDALRYGEYHGVPADSSAVWAFLRYQETEQTVLVAINLSGSADTVDLDLTDTAFPTGMSSSTVTDVETLQNLPNITAGNKSAYPVTIPGYGYRVLEVDLIPQEQEPEPNQYDGLAIPTDVGTAHRVALQDNHTDMGDNIGEANSLYLRATPDGLKIGIPGNNGISGAGFVMLFDTGPGGQNTLLTGDFSTPPTGIPPLDGTVLDAGFAPDVLIFANQFSGTLYVDHYELLTGGAGDKRYIGSNSVDSGDGVLSGSGNTYGMILALSNSNDLGVTDVSATGADTATAGLEGLLPYEDLGLDPAAEDVTLMVMMVYADGTVSNQVLPGVGGGLPDLGSTPDFTTVPGQQYLTVNLGIPGDYNGDRVVDLADFASFPACMTGPEEGGYAPACEAFDSEPDGDIDTDDYAKFQSVYTFY